MSDQIFMAEVVQPVLIKDGGLFLCCKADGDVAAACGSGLGLFHRDTRYLSRYELRIGGEPPLTLMSSAARGGQSVHELTNAAIRQLDGAPLDVQSLGLRLERTADREASSLTDRLALRNFTAKPVSFRVTVTLDALFEDLFELRGAKAKRRGPPRKVTASKAGLAFRYRGADGVARSLTAAFSRAPSSRFRGAGGWRRSTCAWRARPARPLNSPSRSRRSGRRPTPLRRRRRSMMVCG